MILDTETSTKAEDRLANLVELLELASSFESMEEFIQNTALDTSDDDDPENDDKVQLLTMHSSKGLEWPAVIIVDAAEGINPHWKAVGDPKKLDEERRLFYVAMTRAQKYLFITRPKTMFQQGVPQRTIESRFVREIDKKYIRKHQKS
jgi:DNA helicase-2/ATP-dependent DNA helicase PcrA